MPKPTAKQSAERERNRSERTGDIAKRFSSARALFVGLAMLALAGCGDMDSTDNHVEGKQSGFTLLIDHGTGCQYLESRTLTPRIASDGKTHMGCRDAAPARGGL
jgi:hypothetical protein